MPGFSEDVWKRLVEHIFDAKEFTPDMLSAPEVRSAIDETCRILTHGVDSAIKRQVPQELIDHLHNDTFLFSGFKTYHTAREISAMLLDPETGSFKNFDKFFNEVRSIDERYNHAYLRAEYNFAVQSTQMAVKWHDFEKDGDRYLLQYRTANDGLVRPEHQALHNTTLPIDDPFWDSYTPPLGWNCRCTVVQVRRGKYPESDSATAIKAGEAATAKPKQQIFRFNPGKTERVFPPRHPYLPKGCGDCQYRKQRRLGYNPSNPTCQACLTLSKMVETGGTQRPTAEDIRTVREVIQEWVRCHLPIVVHNGNPTRQSEVMSNQGDILIVRNKFFTETLAKNIRNPQLARTIEIATRFDDWMPNMIEQSPEQGIHHPCTFRVFETSYESCRIRMKAKEINGEKLAYTMRILP